MQKHLIGAGRFAVVLGIAVIAGVAVALASALIGHEVLVLRYGEDLSVIDDTLPMIVAVWTSYSAGILAGIFVLVVGWRRFVRRSTAPRDVARLGGSTSQGGA